MLQYEKPEDSTTAGGLERYAYESSSLFLGADARICGHTRLDTPLTLTA